MRKQDEIKQVIKIALNLAYPFHIKDPTAQCSDKEHFNGGNFGCKRCDLLNAIEKGLQRKKSKNLRDLPC